jgi:hypothetical protein
LVNLDYLIFPEDGWGYLHPEKEIIHMMEFIREKYNPSNLLEIGFYSGHSTSMWAQILNETSIVSCVPPHPRATKYAPIVEKHNPNVKVHLIPSPKIYDTIKDINFDIAFIDGNHTEVSVWEDIHMCRKLGIHVLLFDNYELESVRKGIEGRLNAEPNAIWEYPVDFKGKVGFNQIALIDLTTTNKF